MRSIISARRKLRGFEHLPAPYHPGDERLHHHVNGCQSGDAISNPASKAAAVEATVGHLSQARQGILNGIRDALGSLPQANRSDPALYLSLF